MKFVVDAKPSFLIITIYGAFYLCEKYVREKGVLHLINCWFFSRRGKNQFFENAYVRYKTILNVVEDSPFKSGDLLYKEIYNYLNSRKLISEKIKEKLEGKHETI